MTYPGPQAATGATMTRFPHQNSSSRRIMVRLGPGSGDSCRHKMLQNKHLPSIAAPNVAGLVLALDNARSMVQGAHPQESR